MANLNLSRCVLPNRPFRLLSSRSKTESKNIHRLLQRLRLKIFSIEYNPLSIYNFNVVYAIYCKKNICIGVHTLFGHFFFKICRMKVNSFKVHAIIV